MTKIISAGFAVAVTLMLGACTVETGDAMSDEVVTQDRELVTGGVSGDPDPPCIPPAFACQKPGTAESNYTKVKFWCGDFEVSVLGEGLPCQCPERAISNGHLHRDDPNAPRSFFCRNY